MDAAPSPIKQRGLVIESLDAWRGFAALWVVLKHASLPTIASQFPALATSAIFFFPLYGSLGVPIFFVISGFCITNAAAALAGEYNAPVRFVRARFRRLYPPYAVMSVIAFAAAIAAVFAVRHHIFKSSALALANPLHQGWLYYFSALTLTQIPLKIPPILGPFWSLSYEAWFYAIVLAGIFLAPRLRTGVVPLLHLVTAMSLLLFIVNPPLAFFPLDKWPQFGIGVLLYDALRNPNHPRHRYVAIVFAAGILACCLLHPGAQGIVGDPPLDLILATCVVAGLLMWLTYPFDRRMLRLAPLRWLASVGAFSYSLYLSHYLVVGLVMQVFKRLHYTQQTFVIVFIAQAVVAVIVGYAFYRICEVRFTSSKAKRIHQEATTEGMTVSPSLLESA